ncbi:MAG: hypothetical protein SV775_09905 [Thermodesulfobacteriota bacterium]|nr:hypothetical protein [Thermodesulfobacteriota bacterium]
MFEEYAGFWSKVRFMSRRGTILAGQRNSFLRGSVFFMVLAGHLALMTLFPAHSFALQAGFTAVPWQGEAPLTVVFTDKSVPSTYIMG